MPNKKLMRSHRKMDTIKCECGAEIMVLPDVKSMGYAIEIHVAVHMAKVKDPADANAEAERLRDVLIAQIFHLAFSKASDSENVDAFEIGLH